MKSSIFQLGIRVNFELYFTVSHFSGMIYDGNETYYVHPLPNNTDKVNVMQFMNIISISLIFGSVFFFLLKFMLINERHLYWRSATLDCSWGRVLLACEQALRGTLSVGRKRGRACSQVSSIPDTCKLSSFFALLQEHPREPAYRLGHSL